MRHIQIVLHPAGSPSRLLGQSWTPSSPGTPRRPGTGLETGPERGRPLMSNICGLSAARIIYRAEVDEFHAAGRCYLGVCAAGAFKGRISIVQLW